MSTRVRILIGCCHQRRNLRPRGLSQQLQVLDAIFQDPKDTTTKVSMIYANQSTYNKYTAMRKHSNDHCSLVDALRFLTPIL